MRLSAIITLCSLLFTATGFASDLAKEQRWKDQIVDALLDGDEATLNDGKNDFLGIITEADEPQKTAVILMHGIGVHPDWEQVIKPLRVELPAMGWTTLSIQMPVLPNEAEEKDYLPLLSEAAPRIAAGIAYLKDNGYDDAILIAHSLGARMASMALSEDKVSAKAYVAIGMGPGNIEHLSNIKIPMLDLYGSEDLPDVVSSAAKRAAAENPATAKQVRIEGANHYFDDNNEVLLETVSNWIKSLP
ncbi:MAG: DUF3530 family protein [bacterium]